MKKILFIILALVFIAVPISADEKKAEPKYEVKIEVVYNAISIKEADRIIGNAMRNHSDACKVNIETKKVDESFGLATSSSLDYIITDAN